MKEARFTVRAITPIQTRRRTTFSTTLRSCCSTQGDSRNRLLSSCTSRTQSIADAWRYRSMPLRLSRRWERTVQRRRMLSLGKERRRGRMRDAALIGTAAQCHLKNGDRQAPPSLNQTANVLSFFVRLQAPWVMPPCRPSMLCFVYFHWIAAYLSEIVSMGNGLSPTPRVTCEIKTCLS